MILEDYERCLTKHNASLADLLRIYQREVALKRKLSLDLKQVWSRSCISNFKTAINIKIYTCPFQAAKTESKQKKRAKSLDKSVTKILHSVEKLTGKPVGPSEKPTDRIESLNQAVDDLRRQIDTYR